MDNIDKNTDQFLTTGLHEGSIQCPSANGKKMGKVDWFTDAFNHKDILGCL